MRPQSNTLTGQELEIMRDIWPRERATVREVYESLRESRSIAYTSVQTMMNVLVKKGHLVRTPGDRAHVYVPAQAQEQVVGSMVREFVQRVFDGSARPLLVHLAGTKGLSAKDRRALRQLLDVEDER
jgi:predicted transcriptional regulator